MFERQFKHNIKIFGFKVSFIFGFKISFFFGSFGNEPMQSCSVHRVSLLLSLAWASSVMALLALVSVYSPPSDRFDHRSFISYKCMQLCP